MPRALTVALLALPLAGLALLAAQPELDHELRDQQAHFWLVLLLAVVNVALGLAMSEAARRREDARLFLVSLAFLTSAGFLGLHALATPGVLLDSPNTGFGIATPIGLVLAAVFAAVSALDLDTGAAAAIMRRQALLRGGLVALLVAWAVLSLAAVPPLDDEVLPERAGGPYLLLGAIGTALYAFAAVRYGRLYRTRPTPVLAAIAVAFVLLAEALLTVALSRSWHVSWWEWHVLMAAAFGLVAWSARREYRRTGALPATFGGLYLEGATERLDERYARALTEAVEGRELAGKHGLSADEAELLVRAAAEVKRIDELFRPYLGSQLAAHLQEQPERAALGGEEREVSVLFADLQGFTAFSEDRSPAEVIGLLNEYWGRVAPIVAAEGGVIERFAGDAIMVVFNAAAEQPDHAARAARAGLALQGEAERVAAEQPGAPRFRVGINTGRAIVGNVGSAEQRSFAAIGDTTNLAARLQASAAPGSVVIGQATRAALRPTAAVEPLGPLELKGKSEAVEAWVLVDLASR